MGGINGFGPNFFTQTCQIEHLEAVENRLRESETDRAAQAARVVEERKRRKVSLQLPTSTAIVLLIAALGGGGVWLLWQQAAAAEAVAETERAANEEIRKVLYGSQINVANSL
jgi:hypothetical protein